MNRAPATMLKRASRQSRERGAAVFVVMMAILVLTGVGVWAVRSASLTDLASGNARAGAQTLFITEMAVTTGANYFSLDGIAAQQIKQGKDDEADNSTDDCHSVPAGEFCRNIPMSDIDEVLTARATAAGNTPYDLLDLAGAQGSLGPVAGLLEADFRFELTDRRDVVIEGGNNAQKGMYQEVTITSFGQIRPTPTGAGVTPVGQMCTNTNSPGQNSMASEIGMRATMLIGPITK